MASKKDKPKQPAPTSKWGRMLTREELIALLKKIYPDWKPDSEQDKKE